MDKGWWVGAAIVALRIFNTTFAPDPGNPSSSSCLELNHPAPQSQYSENNHQKKPPDFRTHSHNTLLFPPPKHIPSRSIPSQPIPSYPFRPLKRRIYPSVHSPVRPLLVQHTVPALLAADGIAALQRDFVVAVAAQVVHRALRVFEAAAAGLEACVRGAGGAEVGLAGAAGGGGLVLFAGHGLGVLWYCSGCWLVEWDGLVGWLVGNVARAAGGGTSFKVQGKPRSLSLSAKHVKEALLSALLAQRMGSARLALLAPMSRSGKRGPNAYSR